MVKRRVPRPSELAPLLRPAPFIRDGAQRRLRHAGSIAELMGRPGIRLLHDTGAFGAYVGIRRRTDRFDYIYSVTPWENALGSR